MFRKLRTPSRGQGMTEYLIITALIAISAIAVIRVTGNSLKVGFGKVASALQGKDYKNKADQVKTEMTKSRDLGDFTYGVDSRD